MTAGGGERRSVSQRRKGARMSCVGGWGGGRGAGARAPGGEDGRGEYAGAVYLRNLFFLGQAMLGRTGQDNLW